MSLPSYQNYRIVLLNVFGCQSDKSEWFIFDDSYNENISISSIKRIINNKKKIKFGISFNKSLDNKLPHDITHLLLDYYFDKPVINLPFQLKYLGIFGVFNHPVNELPDSLEELVIESNYFQQSLNHLPSKLKKLKIFCNSHSISKPNYMPNLVKLPDELEELDLKGLFYENSLDKLPSNLKKLKLDILLNLEDIRVNLDGLPSQLQILELLGCFDNVINKLPEGLLELSIGMSFNQEINNLPSKLKRLRLSGKFDNLVDNLPPELEKLEFYKCCFDHNIDNLPVTLIELIISGKFNQSLDNLPNGLKYLELDLSGDEVNHVDLNYLPDSLEILNLKYDYHKEIFKLPANIKKIIGNESFIEKIYKYLLDNSEKYKNNRIEIVIK